MYRRTPICIPILGADRIETRLREICAASQGTLRLEVYHRRGDGPHDPLYQGWGRIGDPHYHVLEAQDCVSAEEVREIGASLEFLD